MTRKKTAAPVKAPATQEATIKAIKGFDENLQCRGHQFTPGNTYTVDGKIKACGNGFHACPVDQHPLSVFSYYAPGASRYFDVEVSGETDTHGDKIAAAKITIGVEITIPQLVQRAWDWVWDRAVKSDENHMTADRAAASSTGHYGAASSTGYRGAASSTGNYGAASSTGDQGAASSTGDQGAAMASGYEGKVMGANGNALFAVERNANYEILSVVAAIVGCDGIEPGVWYRCVGGKLVAA